MATADSAYFRQFFAWVAGVDDRLMHYYYAAIGAVLLVTLITNQILAAQILTGFFIGLLTGRATAIDSSS